MARNKVSRHVTVSEVYLTCLLRIPGYSTDCLPAHVIQSQALLLGFDVPNSDKASATPSHHDVWDLFVPIKTLEVVCPGRCIAQAKRIGDIVEVGDEKLEHPLAAARLYMVGISTSPLAPAVASNSDLNGLNWSVLIAPLCFEVRDIKASLVYSLSSSDY